MPQFLTNTMRVCTRDSSYDVQYDAAVPAKPRFPDGTTTPSYEDEEHCSASPYDIPWTLDDRRTTHPSMFAVGNSPMYRGDLWSNNDPYPSENRERELSNTHPGVDDRSWGQSCSDGNLLRCESHADCVPVDNSGALLECVRNVCVRHRTSDISEVGRSCYSHKDCSDTDQLCSGDGRCVDGIWQVENNLDKDIDFELYTSSCSSNDQPNFPVEDYDMYGASVWQTVPDILRMYGMCGKCSPFLSLLPPRTFSLPKI